MMKPLLFGAIAFAVLAFVFKVSMTWSLLLAAGVALAAWWISRKSEEPAAAAAS